MVLEISFARVNYELVSINCQSDRGLGLLCLDYNSEGLGWYNTACEAGCCCVGFGCCDAYSIFCLGKQEGHDDSSKSKFC